MSELGEPPARVKANTRCSKAGHPSGHSEDGDAEACDLAWVFKRTLLPPATAVFGINRKGGRDGFRQPGQEAAAIVE